MAVQETIVLNVKTKGLEAVEKRIARIQRGTNKLGKQRSINRALTTEQLIVRKIAEIEGIISREGSKQVSSQRKVNAGKKKELTLTNRIAKAGRSKRLAAATIGGSFPILFGGGPGASMGGAFGGFVGGPGAGGFAGSLVGSILGSVVDKTVAQAARLGAALNPLTADIEVLTQALGENQSEFGQLIQELAKLGDTERALEEATKRMAQIVGEDGVEALQEFDSEVVVLINEASRAVTAIGALAAVLSGPLLGAINQILRQFNAMQMYNARVRNDPKFAKAEEALINQRTEAALQKSAAERAAKPGGFSPEGERFFLDIEESLTLNNERRRQEQIRANEYRTKEEKENEKLNKSLKDRTTELQAIKAAKTGGGTPRQPTEKADRAAQQMADLTYNRQMLAIKQAYVPLLGEEARLYEIEVQKKEIAYRLERDRQRILAGTSKTKDIELLKAETNAAIRLQDINNKSAAYEAQKLQKFDKLIERLTLELQIQEAVTEEERKQLELKLQMLQVGEGLDKDQKKRVEDLLKKKMDTKKGKIKAYMQELETQLKDTEGIIVSLAKTIEAELGSAMSNAVTGIITGTMTVQEAFADMFANIGKAFIDMASQMIAKALILKVLGVLMPGAGGGGNSIGAAAGAGSAGAAAGAAFAAGGYVTGPTNALIGEGGDSEYVIPSQKMGEAMERYSGGMRGDAVIPSSGDSGGGMGGSGADLSTAINISGGVLNFNDESYIKQDQIPAIINQASKSGEARTLSKLRSSSATRRRVGMA